MAVVDGVRGDLDAVETSEWLEAIDSVLEHDGPGSCPPHPHASRGARPARRHRADRDSQHAVRQHDPARARGEAAGRSGAGAPASVDRALERDGDGGAREQALLRARRPHRELPVAGDAVRGRLQPLLARAQREPRWRPRVLPGPLLARQLRAGVPGGPPHRGAARRLSPGGVEARRPELLPAPVADARLLAVLDGLAGDRPDHLDLPGAVHEVPAGPRAGEDGRAQGVVLRRRRRGRRARDDGLDRPRRPRAARQPDLGRQLQPPAARRPRAGQRQDHPGARVGFPRRRVERDQGDLGQPLGPAAGAGRRRPAGPGDGGVGGRRVPDV